MPLGGTYRGEIDLSSNPNFPAALKGDYYTVGIGQQGRIGGSGGLYLFEGDMITCVASNSGGAFGSAGEYFRFHSFRPINLIPKTFKIQGVPIVGKYEVGETELIATTGQQVILRSGVIDAKTATDVTIDIPALANFYIDELDFLAVDCDTVTVVPSIKAGIVGTLDKFKGITALTGLDTTGERVKITTFDSYSATNSTGKIVVTITTNASATKYDLMIIVKGYLLENQ